MLLSSIGKSVLLFRLKEYFEIEGEGRTSIVCNIPDARMCCVNRLMYHCDDLNIYIYIYVFFKFKNSGFVSNLDLLRVLIVGKRPHPHVICFIMLRPYEAKSINSSITYMAYQTPFKDTDI